VKTKVKRNEPCPCGSGKKSKKCCRGLTKPSTKLVPKKARRAGRGSRRSAPRLNAEERDGMRAAGKFNAHLLDRVREKIAPGVRLADLDDFVREYTQDHGHIPACLGYKGFPKSSCMSVNEVVCHGIPGDYELRDGDIVNVDLTTIVNTWFGDQSETFLIGDVSDEARGVTQCAFDCLYAGIDALVPGGTVMDIGRAIQKLAHGRGYSVVEKFQGHGIGQTFHSEPGVPHYPEPSLGRFVIEPGMCFTIEPMINVGVKGCRVDKRDGWTARTSDGKLSAQFEHTLLMTEEGVEILTPTENGPRPGHTF
jgi:methionyl aminopeptidase